MGTESFPALIRTLQYILLALSVFALVGIGNSLYIYYHIRNYNNDEAIEDKKNLRKQISTGLIFIITCLIIAALLFFVGPAFRLLLVGL